MVPVGSSGLCWPGGWLFPGCVCVCVLVGGGGEGGVDWGLWALSKVESSVHVRASPSEVYPAGKLQ